MQSAPARSDQNEQNTQIDSITNSSSVGNEQKHIAAIILSIFGVICLLTTGLTAGSYYLINYGIEQRNAITVTAQADKTATAISHAAEVLDYEYFDDFSDNSNRWDVSAVTEQGWDGSIRLRDGKYVWSVTNAQDDESFMWRSYDDPKSLRDFDLSLDVKQVDGTPGMICPGVAFRVNFKGSQYVGSYIFSICDDQQFHVDYFDSTVGWDVIQPWTTTAAIHPGEWNNIAVRARDNHFVLSINSEVIYEFDDMRLRQGKTFLLIQIYETEPGVIWFDNFGLQSR